MLCCNLHVDIEHKKLLANEEVCINDVEGLWSYAKEQLINSHDITKKRSPIYLEEMEFDCNNQDKSLFNLLLQICRNQVPELL